MAVRRRPIVRSPGPHPEAPLPVVGYVRNLRDGRVELVVEGAPDDVADALRRLESRLHPYIQHSKRSSMPATGEFAAFEIRR